MENITKQCHSCWMRGEEFTANDILSQLLSKHPDIGERAEDSLAGELVGNETLLEQEVCGFSLIAQVIANNSNLEPFEKSLLIGEARISARKKSCPCLNNINPDYPGKNTL